MDEYTHNQMEGLAANNTNFGFELSSQAIMPQRQSLSIMPAQAGFER